MIITSQSRRKRARSSSTPPARTWNKFLEEQVKVKVVKIVDKDDDNENEDNDDDDDKNGAKKGCRSPKGRKRDPAPLGRPDLLHPLQHRSLVMIKIIMMMRLAVTIMTRLMIVVRYPAPVSLGGFLSF